MSDEKLLKEYIETLLSEESGDGYGAGGGYDYGYNDTAGFGYGGFNSGDSLQRMLKDVGKIAVGGMKGAAEEFSARVWTVFKVAKEAILATLVPGLEADFKKIFDREKQLLADIKTKYAEVFRMVDEYAFHEDFVFLAFMWNPSAVITSAVARNAPGSAIELLKIFATGNDELYNALQKMKHIVDSNGGDEALAANKKGEKSGKGQKAALDVGAGAAIVAVRDRLKKLSKNKKIQDLISNNSMVGNLQNEAETITKSFLEKLYTECQEELAKVKTIGDIAKNYPQADLRGLDKANAEDRGKLEQRLVSDVKHLIKGSFERQIQGRIRRGEKLGFPSESQFMELHNTALKKIRSL